MKFWIGGAAKSSNVACIFAQMYVGGENKGIHAFAIKIRD
jgi:hypothetical protein